MSDFNLAVNEILIREGGFSDDKDDPGGATKYGISLRFLQSNGIDFNHDKHFDIEDVKNMTYDNAKDIYKQYWWDKFSYYTINDQKLVLKIFDFSVNAGPVAAHKTAQKAINNNLERYKISEDGLIGSMTFHYLNTLNTDNILDSYIILQKQYYQNIVLNHPSSLKFLKGWLNRAAMT